MAGKRQIQEINASSMADIAFLLLIFFLVATTMNVDTGITRMLPPIPPDEVITDDMKVKERNLLQILVNNNDQIMVMGMNTHITQLTDAVKRFTINATDDPNMPEKELKEIDMPDGSKWSYMVSKGVVSLQSTTGASYEAYIQVQNELARAFNEMRNDASHAKFGRDYKDLIKEEQDAINDAVPLAISEAEPRNVGGN